jgi:hypothetical protein
MMTGTEGRIDPLVPEETATRVPADCSSKTRAAAPKSGSRWIAAAVAVALASCEMATRPPSVSAPEADGEEWALTRAPPPGDQTTICFRANTKPMKSLHHA